MNSIFEHRLVDPHAESAFGESNVIDAMLRFEAALARAQADAGLIPPAAAQSIVGTCKVDLFDVPKMVRDSAGAGSIAIPFIASLTETVGLFNPQATDFVHFGCGNQDLMDCTMALLTRDALALIEADTGRTISALLALATRHASDPVLERDVLQARRVTSFGLRCAHWAAPLVRSRQRLQTLAASALSVQWAGASAPQAQGKGEQVLALLAEELKLCSATAASMAQRDEWVALACETGLLVGSLGSMAREITLMAQQEVAELGLSAPPQTIGVSSRVKDDAFDGCRLALEATQRTPHRVAALLTALSQDSGRSIGEWQAALAEWPALFAAAHSCANAMARTVSDLQVNPQSMRNHIETLRSNWPATLGKEQFKPEWMLQAAALTHRHVERLASA